MTDLNLSTHPIASHRKFAQGIYIFWTTCMSPIWEEVRPPASHLCCLIAANLAVTSWTRNTFSHRAGAVPGLSDPVALPVCADDALGPSECVDLRPAALFRDADRPFDTVGRAHGRRFHGDEQPRRTRCASWVVERLRIHVCICAVAVRVLWDPLPARETFWIATSRCMHACTQLHPVPLLD